MAEDAAECEDAKASSFILLIVNRKTKREAEHVADFPFCFSALMVGTIGNDVAVLVERRAVLSSRQP